MDEQELRLEEWRHWNYLQQLNRSRDIRKLREELRRQGKALILQVENEKRIPG